MAFRFLNQLNPHKTGHMHGILSVHIGMRLRLLAKFNADMGLVQETCCTVVDFELHEQDRLRYAATAPGELFHPNFLPAGIWVSVDNYDKCPIWESFVETFDDGCNAFSAGDCREAGQKHVVPACHGNHRDVFQYPDASMCLFSTNPMTGFVLVLH